VETKELTILTSGPNTLPQNTGEGAWYRQKALNKEVYKKFPNEIKGNEVHTVGNKFEWYLQIYNVSPGQEKTVADDVAKIINDFPQGPKNVKATQLESA